MQHVNGLDQAGTGATTPATAVAAVTLPTTTQGNGISFKKAVKFAAKGRVALIGPAGSGKSYTSLLLARTLAGPNGKIAAIDTEHGSLSKYADVFDFDVIELDSFSPDTFTAALHAAEESGYDVFLCDSLSHFWMGKDGALEFVDMAQKRSKDQQGGWKDLRPHERRMVDDLISSSCHVICTMRTKTDYQNQMVDGKNKRVKVGLAPVQRDGLEYYFDLVGYMDDDNTFITDKTRCSFYAQKAYTKPGPKEFQPLVEWLQGVKREPRPIVAQIATGGHPAGTQAAADAVAQAKIAAGSAGTLAKAPWKNMIEVEQFFQAMRESVGEVIWREQLERNGWRELVDIRNAMDNPNPELRAQARQKAREMYWRLDAIARKAVA